MPKSDAREGSPHDHRPSDPSRHCHAHGHSMGKGNGSQDSGTAWPEPDSEEARAVQALLVASGYDPGDAGAFRQGTAAYLAAQMLAFANRDPGAAADATVDLAAPLPAADAPCPCGSALTYRDCCQPRDAETASFGLPPASRAAARLGVAPETIPRTDPETLLADNTLLAHLFLEDPDLRAARFPLPALSAFLEDRPAPPAEDPVARDAWFRDTGHAFVAAQYEQGGLESEAVQAVLGLKERFLAAATRLGDRPDALRAVALGLLYHSVFSPEAEQPNPLAALLFRLTLYDTAHEQQRRVALLEALENPGEGEAARWVAGEREAFDRWQQTFDALPSDERSRRIADAEAFHQGVQEAIVRGTFPVPLPLPSVLPLLLHTLRAMRGAPEGSEEAIARARETSARIARQGLTEADRELYVALCDEWFAAGDEPGAPATAARQVRYARALAAQGPSSLEPLLLLAFLDHHQVTPLFGEPNPDPEAGVELDSPAFLARYGRFLERRGRLALALRTYELCALDGSASPDVTARVTALRERIAQQN